jgi:hypothetical protein
VQPIKLDLSYNQLGSTGLIELIHFIKKNPQKITNLHVAYNNITENGC